jgi:hypothetical protein
MERLLEKKIEKDEVETMLDKKANRDELTSMSKKIEELENLLNDKINEIQE